MQRYRNEMDACSDILAAQLADEFIAIDVDTTEVQSQRVEVPGVPASVRLREVKFRHIGESLAVTAGYGSAPCCESLDLSQLMYPDRGLNITQIVFETRAATS